MTSTSTSSGYSLQRNSSKVIQPPGGKTADIFGRSTQDQNPSSASSLAGSDVGLSREAVAAAVHQDGGQASPSLSADLAIQQQPSVTSSDDFRKTVQQQVQAESTQQQSDIPSSERTAAQQAKINVPRRRNPITGEVYQDDAGQQASGRVRQPPGGRSSGIF